MASQKSEIDRNTFLPVKMRYEHWRNIEEILVSLKDRQLHEQLSIAMFVNELEKHKRRIRQHQEWAKSKEAKHNGNKDNTI